MNAWTEIDRNAIRALCRCAFRANSHKQGYISALLWRARDDRAITDSQLLELWNLVWHYRETHQDENLTCVAAFGLSLDALVKWMRGPQGVPAGSFVEHLPLSHDDREQQERANFARWVAG